MEKERLQQMHRELLMFLANVSDGEKRLRVMKSEAKKLIRKIAEKLKK